MKEGDLVNGADGLIGTVTRVIVEIQVDSLGRKTTHELIYVDWRIGSQ